MIRRPLLAAPAATMLPLLAVAALVIPSSAAAQSDAAAIEMALAPMPARTAEGAGVIRWNADHTYQTLKESENQWVCYDRSDEPRRAPFDVQCTNIGNLERVAQSRRFQFEAEGDRQAVSAMVDAAEADGSRVVPVFGSMWIAMRGQDQASAGIHTTIAVPGATAESLGLPDNGRMGTAYVMGGGTTTAHIMVPGR